MVGGLGGNGEGDSGAFVRFGLEGDCSVVRFDYSFGYVESKSCADCNGGVFDLGEF